VTLKKISGEALPIKVYGKDYVLEDEISTAIS
jgi:maltose phosphorylase